MKKIYIQLGVLLVALVVFGLAMVNMEDITMTETQKIPASAKKYVDISEYQNLEEEFQALPQSVQQELDKLPKEKHIEYMETAVKVKELQDIRNNLSQEIKSLNELEAEAREFSDKADQLIN